MKENNPSKRVIDYFSKSKLGYDIILSGIKHFGFYNGVKKDITEKVQFLGEAYAYGAKAFEEKPSVKDQIVAINEKIYFANDAEINKIYTETRGWSLEYFDGIYKKFSLQG